MGCGKLAYKGRVDLFVTWGAPVTFNAGSTYECSSCSRRIWLLEFFIHKISNGKNRDRQPSPPPPKKKDEHPLTKKQNKTKTKQVKMAAARVWQARTNPDLTLSWDLGTRLPQTLPRLDDFFLFWRARDVIVLNLRQKKTHTQTRNTIVVEAFYQYAIYLHKNNNISN